LAQVVFSAAALDDLDRLHAFLLEAVPEHAQRLIGEVLQGFAVLEAHPRIGRRTTAGLRELVISQGRSGYLALYRHDEARDLVRVLRVRHQREAGYRD
jgi:addiction module RelE/StbE family toxin